MKQTSSVQHNSRTGFSLVELLIVIGIIAILVTILVIAIGPTLTSARISATQTTISQIDDVIQKRVDAIIRAKPEINAAAKRLASSSPLSVPQAEFIIRKNAFRMALPQRIEDFYGYDQASGGGDDATLPGSFTVADSDGSEPLFLALTELSSIELLPGGRTITLPTLLRDDLNPAHVDDTDADGNTEFVDEWGQQLVFYLWPTRLVRPDGPGNPITNLQYNNASILITGLTSFTGNSLSDTDFTNALNLDPANPNSLLDNAFGSSINVTLPSSSGSIMFTIAPFTSANYHDADTFSAPLLMSGGPDQAIGLGEPNSSTVAERLGEPTGTFDVASRIYEDITDNITNRQQ